MTTTTPDGSGVASITTLVQRKLDAGLSTRQLARACDDVVAHQTFASLAKGDIKGWPKNPATVRGLALALEVDARAVILGFAVALGIDVNEERSTLATLLPASAHALTYDQARTVAQITKWLADGNRDTQPSLPTTEDWWEDKRRRTWAHFDGDSPAPADPGSKAARRKRPPDPNDPEQIS